MGTTDIEVGRRVHRMLWDRQRTQTEVADALGVSPSTLSLKLRGHRKWTLDEVLVLSRWLDVPPGELLPDVGRVGIEPTPGGVWVTQSAYAAAA